MIFKKELVHHLLQDVVGISVENWLNQKLLSPIVTLSAGSRDRWYKPVAVEKHSRDIVLLAYSEEGSGTKGSLSYLVEDSWPRAFICLGWNREKDKEKVELLISVTENHLEYDRLLAREETSHEMKVSYYPSYLILSSTIQDMMRYYRATRDYVVAVTCRDEGAGLHLVLSVIPQHLDVWAWEKYYKQSHLVSVQRIDILQTESLPTIPPLREEEDSGPGIFHHKELLMIGESVRTWQGNLTQAQVLGATPGSVAGGIRVENWSRHTLGDPRTRCQYGKESTHLPLTPVKPGMVELAVLEQDKRGSGVSCVARWSIGSSSTVLSLMISIPYNTHLWSSWVAAGITDKKTVPDFTAMYSGTQDSSWFLRQKMGGTIEFANSELVLVVESDSSTSKPMVRLSVVPLDQTRVAASVEQRLENLPRGRKGQKHSVLALSSQYSHAMHYTYTVLWTVLSSSVIMIL